MEVLIRQCAAHQPEMVKFLESIVNIDSKVDNPEGIKQVAEIIGEKLKTLGFDVKYLDGNGLPTHVHAFKKGNKPDAKNIMILGHMDTVFDKGTAKERPFTIIGDKAYGPGVADMKSGITIALFAIQSLGEIGWNDHNLTVFFCGDEEPGHPKTDCKEKLIEAARDMDVVFNMETGVDNGDVVIARRGVLYPEFIVEGISAHSGKDPEKGANAIKEIAHKIGELYKLDDPVKGINFNAGIIKGGIVANGIAGHAELYGDFRFDKAEDLDYIKQALKAVADDVYVPRTKTHLTINDNRTFLPMEQVDGAQEVFDLIKEQGDTLGFDIKPIVVGSGSDSCWTTSVGVPTICAMGGRGGLNHSEKEYLYIDSLTDRTQLLALTIQNLT